MSRIDRERYVTPYVAVHTIEHENGYIVWRRGTGDNIELLHLRTFSPGKGTGRELVKEMLTQLLSYPPYDTVFGFTRTINEASQAFYKALGFELSEVKGVYADGHAILFSQRFKTLLEIHDVSTAPC